VNPKPEHRTMGPGHEVIISHYYWVQGTTAVPGDKAVCGHVKRIPETEVPENVRYQICLVCSDLKALS
jgi:DNA gyrase inhibitor GyrI